MCASIRVTNPENAPVKAKVFFGALRWEGPVPSGAGPAPSTDLDFFERIA